MSKTELNSTNILDENVYSKAAELLSCGLLTAFEPPLRKAQKQLKELEEKQQDLINKLHCETLTISEVQHSSDLQAMLMKIKLYHAKLLTLKKDIKVLHERSTKLKKRAMKLQQIKEREPVEEIIITKPTGIIGSSDTS